MKTEDILRTEDFEKVTQLKPDSRNRINLSKVVAKAMLAMSGDTMFRVYINSTGQIILDPLVTIPAHESWIYKNPKAFKSVQRGLEDAKAGRIKKAREDYSQYLTNEE
mgnify:CR=1 FL=1